MNIHGADFLAEESGKPGFFIKAVMNDCGVKFFPGHRQHRDVEAAGFSYEDECRGNALAVIVQPGKVEIRFHEKFSDGRVAGLWRAALAKPECEFMRSWRMTYQGRELSL